MGYLFAGLAFLIIAKVYAGSEDDMMSCLDIFDLEESENITCCDSFDVFKKIDENEDDCIAEDAEEWQCEDYECILRANGMFKDSKIDEDGVEKYLNDLEKEFPKEKEALDRLRNDCLDGKYETYPPEDVCPAHKFYICIYINVYLECSSWKTGETCSKLAESAKKCRSALGF